MPNYLFEYDHDGGRYGFDIFAEDEADARARLAKIAKARYLGEVKAKIPASLGGGLIARAWCVVANFFRRPGPRR